MNRIERIKKILEYNFKPESLALYDNSSKHVGHNNFDGAGMTHLKLMIKSVKFKDKKLLESHNMVNAVLKEEFQNGLHSLEIKIINY